MEKPALGGGFKGVVGYTRRRKGGHGGNGLKTERKELKRLVLRGGERKDPLTQDLLNLVGIKLL